MNSNEDDLLLRFMISLKNKEGIALGQKMHCLRTVGPRNYWQDLEAKLPSKGTMAGTLGSPINKSES